MGVSGRWTSGKCQETVRISSAPSGPRGRVLDFSRHELPRRRVSNGPHRGPPAREPRSHVPPRLAGPVRRQPAPRGGGKRREGLRCPGRGRIHPSLRREGWLRRLLPFDWSSHTRAGGDRRSRKVRPEDRGARAGGREAPGGPPSGKEIFHLITRIGGALVRRGCAVNRDALLVERAVEASS